MGEARGIVSQEEMLAYGGANAVLLDDTNNTTDSSTATASGSQNYTWSISWDSAGFSGVTWNLTDWPTTSQTIKELYTNQGDLAVKNYLEDEDNVGIALGIANSIRDKEIYVLNGCVTYTVV